MDKKKVLIICNSDPISDPRVQRQIKALLTDFDIEVCALGHTGIKSIPFYLIYKQPPFSLTRKIKRMLWVIFRRYDNFYWDDYKKKLVAELSPKKYDVIIANDIQTLPLALTIAANRAKVLFDAHEYHPKESDSFMWKLLYQKLVEYQCKKYIPKTHLFSTVSYGIAEEYEKFTGKKPFVIANNAEYQDLLPTVVNSPIKLVHHGAAIRGRKIERMIDMMQYLDSHVLYLMLTPFDKAYFEHLKRKAGDKVIFLPPVPRNEVCKTLNQFDAGVYILPPTNFNNLHALPNKIYDFIQARLCLVISPNPEMARLVRKYNLGMLSGDFTAETMARVLKNLTPEKIAYHKQQSHLHARTLSAETNIQKIKEVVVNLSNHLN